MHYPLKNLMHEPSPSHLSSCELCSQITEIGRLNLSRQENYKGQDGFRTPLWEFVRTLKAMKTLAELTSGDALKSVENSMAAQGLTWGLCANFSKDDLAPEEEFCHLWDSIKFPIGEGPLSVAIRQADALPVHLAHDFRGDAYTRFVSVAYHLQLLVGDRPILLPCRPLADLLGTSAQTISMRRGFAEKDKFLVRHKEHKFRPGAGSKATEFRFDVSRFNQETRAEIGTYQTDSLPAPRTDRREFFTALG
jgi:hypothetical protein